MQIFPVFRATVAVAAVCSFGAGAHAQTTESTPRGPWLTPTQTVSLQGYLSNEELDAALLKVEETSKGLAVLEPIGATGEGRNLNLVKIGDPANPAVMIITQQHGDEPHGTEAALALIKKLATGSAEAQRILDSLYVLVMPRVNPDGSVIPERGNADFSAPPANTRQCPAAGGSSATGRGIFTTDLVLENGDRLWSYDVNRYHWGDWTESWQFLCNPDGQGGSIYPTNPVPEAEAVVQAYKTYSPIWVIDVHNQDLNVINDDICDTVDYCRDGRWVTGSILWPTNADVAPAAVDFSKQMAVVMKQRSIELGNVELHRYSGGSFPGIARNAYGLLGSALLADGIPGPRGGSILFEVAGQTEGNLETNIGQKARGMLTNGVTKLLMAVLEATADGSIGGIDPALAEIIVIDNDRDLDNPRVSDEE